MVVVIWRSPRRCRESGGNAVSCGRGDWRTRESGGVRVVSEVEEIGLRRSTWWLRMEGVRCQHCCGRGGGAVHVRRLVCAPPGFFRELCDGRPRHEGRREVNAL